MNIVWTTVLLISLVLCAFGNADVISAVTTAAQSSLTTVFSLSAIYCFWCGMFNILEKSGIVTRFAYIIRPIVALLYGKVSVKAQKYIALNISANLLGVGGAATPAALTAIEDICTSSAETDKNIQNSTVDTNDLTQQNIVKKLNNNTEATGKLPQTADKEHNSTGGKGNSPTINGKHTENKLFTYKHNKTINNLSLYKDKPQLPKSIAMLFIINATSIQLLPATVISLRAEHLSVSPADIILPTLITTAFTTFLGIVLGLMFFGEKKTVI